MSLPNSSQLIALIGSRNMAESKTFYGEKLGLQLVSEDGFALVFNAHGTMLRVTMVRKIAPAEYTVLGWKVADIVAAVKGLQESGIVLERFPGVEQDDLGIWTAPGGGARVAWFKDPEGNILSVSQHEGS